jgi:hypothetical protein
MTHENTILMLKSTQTSTLKLQSLSGPSHGPWPGARFEFDRLSWVVVLMGSYWWNLVDITLW